jgi:hypothetical protein
MSVDEIRRTIQKKFKTVIGKCNASGKYWKDEKVLHSRANFDVSGRGFFGGGVKKTRVLVWSLLMIPVFKFVTK